MNQVLDGYFKLLADHPQQLVLWKLYQTSFMHLYRFTQAHLPFGFLLHGQWSTLATIRKSSPNTTFCHHLLRVIAGLQYGLCCAC